MPSNCPVIEQASDGKSVGVCSFFMPDNMTCPRHGIIRHLSHGEDSTTVKASKGNKFEG